MKKVFIVGSINMDLVINTKIMPDNGMTVSGYGFMTNPGGKGANQAVAVAKLGGDAVMVGCVGKEFGDELKNTLYKYGVNVDKVQRKEDVSSGIAVIIVHEGDNRIVLDAGANGKVDISLIESGIEKASAGDYYVTQLEIPVDEVVKGLKLAKKRGMITVLNPAPACEIDGEVFKYVDYFMPNQTEARFYTGIYPDDEKSASACAKVLMDMGVKTVVITMGSRGAMAITENEEFFIPSFKVDAVDTTAAGDTFVGATVNRLAFGDGLKDAMTYANKASSITVCREGAQQSIPYKEEVKI